MARKSKRNDKLESKIAEYLSGGSTIKDACAAVGIGEATYYEWVNKFPEFSEIATRAQAVARQRAIEAIRLALNVTEQKTETTELIKETRLRTVKRTLENGSVVVEQVPYTHERMIAKTSTTKIPPDWRAGVEYLKRRDKEHWSDKTTVEVEDWRSKAIEDIKAGRIAYKALVEAFDTDLATQLFAEAGLSIQVGEG